jgi:hypothetical protein
MSTACNNAQLSSPESIDVIYIAYKCSPNFSRIESNARVPGPYLASGWRNRDFSNVSRNTDT